MSLILSLFCGQQTKGWVEVLETGLTSSMQLAKMQQSDQKLHCHIWEICRTECENFCRLLAIRDVHDMWDILVCVLVMELLLLWQVYMETMRELKGKGHLETVSTEQLFGNLTEVCAVRMMCNGLSRRDESERGVCAC